MELKNSLSNRLKVITELLIFSDITDLQALCSIHSEFQKIQQEASEAKDGILAEVARIAAETVQKIVLDETKTPEADLALVSKVVSSLQQIASGVDIEQVIFPPELKLPDFRAVAGNKKSVAAKDIHAKKKHDLTDTQRFSLKKRSSESIAAAIAGDPALVADFISEAHEHLDSCNGHLLEIEKVPDNIDSLNAVFRAFHTIKGVASFLNLSDIRRLAHQAENLLDKARSGALRLEGRGIDLIFESVDTMKTMIEDLSNALTTGDPVATELEIDRLIADLAAEVNPSASAPAAPAPAEPEPVAISQEPEPVRLEQPIPDTKPSAPAPVTDFSAPASPSSLPLEIISSELPRFLEEFNDHIQQAEQSLMVLDKNKEDDESVRELFRYFHTIKGSSGFLELTPIEKLAHKLESLLDKVRSGNIKFSSAILDVIFEAIDAFKKQAAKIADSLQDVSTLQFQDFSQLIEKIDQAGSLAPVNADEMKTAAVLLNPDIKPQKIPLAAPTSVPAPTAASANKEDIIQELVSNAMAVPASLKKAHVKETVKVDSERLDKLVDTIGELVIAETMVIQSEELKKIATPALIQILGQLDKITRELQAMGTSLRMVPVSPTFQKMARLARDLSKKINKDLDFVMVGEDTELDKTVVDAIGDPLVHMVRNAIDHGLEKTVEDRLKAGKSPKGRVELRAFHKGGSIYIEVQDDGRGINKDVVLQKATEKGLVTPGQELTEKEIYALLMAPGFSTAEAVTEVSGRGVGMDVVKKNIEALRGQIDIQSTQGKGSIFSIKLPLTLAIIDGMVISVAADKYIIPTLSIVMSVRVTKSEIRTIQHRGEFIKLQEELIPVFHLERVFSPESCRPTPEECLIVIIEDDGRKTGIIIDELLGQQQIVIKSLGDYLKEMPGIAGGAIMPDGTVGLILDVGSLVKLATSN